MADRTYKKGDLVGRYGYRGTYQVVGYKWDEEVLIFDVVEGDQFTNREIERTKFLYKKEATTSETT